MKASAHQESIVMNQTPSMKNWSPTPAFTLRRSAIRDAIRSWKPGSFLEAGIGTGTMTTLLLEQGFTGHGFDITTSNLELARSNLKSYDTQLSLIDRLEQLPPQSVDYLFAFEVLEHIEKDHSALASWTTHLRPGGRVLVSVPARMKKFRADDHYVGHVRRYEKSELTALLSSQGYQDIQIASYGFPLMNLSRSIGARLHPAAKPKGEEPSTLSQVDRSILSGTERLDLINKLSRAIGTHPVKPFSVLQRAFYSRDWGEGYIASATYRPDLTARTSLPA